MQRKEIHINCRVGMITLLPCLQSNSGVSVGPGCGGQGQTYLLFFLMISQISLNSLFILIQANLFGLLHKISMFMLSCTLFEICFMWDNIKVD